MIATTRNLDLDAARAARQEAQGEPPTITYNGKVYTLPQELRLSQLEAFLRAERENDLRGVIVALLADRADEFLADDPSYNDLKAMGDGLQELYGIGLPESGASNGSSPSGGGRSRRTSRATTR